MALHSVLHDKAKRIERYGRSLFYFHITNSSSQER